MEILKRLRLIINKDNNFIEAVRHLNNGDRKIIIDIYSGEKEIDVKILEILSNLGYNINWLISGEGSIKNAFIDENNLNEYDKLIFNTYFDEVIQLNDIIIPDFKLEVINKWLEFKVVTQKSDLIIYDAYNKYLRLTIFKIISDSKYFVYIMDCIHIKENVSETNYFFSYLINLIESNTVNAEPHKSNIELNRELGIVELNMFFQYIACLYSLVTEVYEYNKERKKFEYDKVNETIEDMRYFIRNQIKELDNESYLFEKGKPFIKIIESTFNIVIENKL